MWWVPDGRWHEAAGLPSGRAELGRMETHCLAGHVRFELRNVGANYPFERSHGFPGIKLKSGHRDYSRVELQRRDAQLGPRTKISASGGH